MTYIGTNTNGVKDADFDTVKSVGSRSFSLNNANQDQLTVNNETVYVLATYDLKDNKSTYKAPSVGDGSLDDLKEDVKNDGDYFTYVYVAKTSNDGKTADLIFIEQWEKKPTVYSTVNYSAVTGTTLTVTANGQPVASGDKVANGTALTITATATDAVNYDVTVKDQAGNTVTSPYTVNGNVTLTTVLTEKDKSVKVDLVFNQDAIVTIDGKEYLADQEISLLPGTYDFEAVYAGGVPAYAQAVAGDANVSVKTYGSAEKLIVTAAGTLTVGVETFDLTLPANVTGTWDTQTANANATTAVPKDAVVTITYEAADDTATDWASATIEINGVAETATIAAQGNGTGTKAKVTYQLTMTEDTTVGAVKGTPKTYTVTSSVADYELKTDKEEYVKGETVKVTLTKTTNGVTANTTVNSVTATPTISISNGQVTAGTVDTPEIVTFDFTIAADTELTAMVLA